MRSSRPEKKRRHEPERQPTPLLGLGPVSLRILRKAGIRTRADLEKLGPVEAFIAAKRVEPTVTLNLLWGIAGALTNTHWSKLTPDYRSTLLLEYDGRVDAERTRLVDRVRAALQGVPQVEEKRMFGGNGFMVRGHLCVTARPTRIMCRIDPALHEAAIKRKGARTVIMRGREYLGYVHVDASALTTQRALAYWVKLALRFNATLPTAAK